MPLEPVSGSSGDEGTPRDVRGGDDVHERARLGSLGAYSKSDALRTGDAGDASQEAILDLIVAATLEDDRWTMPRMTRWTTSQRTRTTGIRAISGTCGKTGTRGKIGTCGTRRPLPRARPPTKACRRAGGLPQRASSMGRSPDLRSLG